MRLFSFSFDDGYRSWRDAARVLDKYGYRGTFNTVLRNVVYRRVKTRPRMFPVENVITWKELKNIQRAGHEIGCHGTRHIDLNLCNRMELWMELVASKKVFESHGVNVNTFTCAFNTWDQETKDYALDHYDSFRASTGVNELPLKDKVYHAMDGTKAAQFARDCLDDDVWIIGIWHDVNFPSFESSIGKVQSTRWKVMTVREVYELYSME